MCTKHEWGGFQHVDRAARGLGTKPWLVKAAQKQEAAAAAAAAATATAVEKEKEKQVRLCCLSTQSNPAPIPFCRAPETLHCRHRASGQRQPRPRRLTESSG